MFPPHSSLSCLLPHYPPKGLDIMRMDRLRQYLLFEFASPLGQPGVLPFAFDLEYVIQDFVFLCIFVGNDFLPRLPSLDIREGGLDMLLALYKGMLPGLGTHTTQHARDFF